MKLYSSDLAKYHVDDVRTAVDVLSHRLRKEGETAFPDLPTIDDAVWEAKNARLRTEREAREKAQAEAEERDRLEHPENYVDAGPNLAKFFAEFFAKRGISTDPRPLPRKGLCEHCHGVQLSALTAADLRALADVLEKREKGDGQTEAARATQTA